MQTLQKLYHQANQQKCFDSVPDQILPHVNSTNYGLVKTPPKWDIEGEKKLATLNIELLSISTMKPTTSCSSSSSSWM